MQSSCFSSLRYCSGTKVLQYCTGTEVLLYCSTVVSSLFHHFRLKELQSHFANAFCLRCFLTRSALPLHAPQILPSARLQLWHKTPFAAASPLNHSESARAHTHYTHYTSWVSSNCFQIPALITLSKWRVPGNIDSATAPDLCAVGSA